MPGRLVDLRSVVAHRKVVERSTVVEEHRMVVVNRMVAAEHNRQHSTFLAVRTEFLKSKLNIL